MKQSMPLEELRSILSHTLGVDDMMDWNALKRNDTYTSPEPDQPAAETYVPAIGLFDHLLPSRKRRKVDESSARYRAAVTEWRQQVAAWRADKEKFAKQIAIHNSAIDAQRLRYVKGDPDAVAEYCDLVLARSSYPDEFPQEFQTDYDDSTRTVVVEYRVPAPGDLPTLREVRYIASRDEYKETHLKDAEVRALYDQVVYQIALRTIHEVLEADEIDAIDAVVFNGWVNYIDPRNGSPTRACIASVQTTKDEFNKINLGAVEPRECFRALKGVAAARLASIAPVAPILQLNRQDARFVAGQGVTGSIGAETNIAAIGWEEFEHLVREIFAAEFSTGGGEVKVTQSSRDGGVDAIAFDPDPVRGGKIVIQAKRYTNPVDVSAVRDLYGTVMNEGAIKGILVTTSTFGPDAYRFAKDKPLTLLNGGNLLHLLAKHGHKARIDLKEAKTLGVALKR
jgi:restriction system protein